jgi:hypothetical protein
MAEDQPRQESTKIEYGAIPVRAFRDARLSGAHFRVLGAIAFRDRFGRNGIGCYSGTATLAKDTGLHAKSVSRAAAELETFGYLERGKIGRMRTFRVLYEPPTGNEPVTHSRPGAGTEGNEPVTDTGEIGNKPNSQVPENAERTPPQYIPLSGNQINPAEAAAPSGAAGAGEGFEGNGKRLGTSPGSAGEGYQGDTNGRATPAEDATEDRVNSAIQQAFQMLREDVGGSAVMQLVDMDMLARAREAERKKRDAGRQLLLREAIEAARRYKASEASR